MTELFPPQETCPLPTLKTRDRYLAKLPQNTAPVIVAVLLAPLFFPPPILWNRLNLEPASQPASAGGGNDDDDDDDDDDDGDAAAVWLSVFTSTLHLHL